MWAKVSVRSQILIDLSIVPQDFPMPQDPSMRSESCMQVKEAPHQTKEFTLDEEVGPKLVSIQERQGSIRTALKFNKVDEDNIEKTIIYRKITSKFVAKFNGRCQLKGCNEPTCKNITEIVGADMFSEETQQFEQKASGNPYWVCASHFLNSQVEEEENAEEWRVVARLKRR